MSAVLLLAAMSSTSASAAVKGELWEMTTKMDMPGMTMPEVTETVCMHRGAGYKPGKVPHVKNCKTTGLNVDGNKTSWKVRCPGKDGMAGSGEVIRHAGSMKGSMKLSSKDMQMTQVITGRRVGTCELK